MTEDRPTERTVTLDYPVEYDGKTIAELKLRRIKAKDMLTLDKVSQDRHGLALVAIIARVPIPVIEELDTDDWEEVQRAAIPFMPKSQRRIYEATTKALDRLSETDVEALIGQLVRTPTG